VIEMFFKLMESDYQQAKTRCKNAIITGYTSNVMVNAYGANYMFDRDTSVPCLHASRRQSVKQQIRLVLLPLVDAGADTKRS